MSEYRQCWSSPLGEMLLMATDDALVGAWFTDQKYAPNAGDFRMQRQESKIIQNTIEWLTRYFADFDQSLSIKEHDLDAQRPKLAPRGTDFQQQVWQALLRIPAGSTNTYGQHAKTIDKPAAVRAVAAAIGRNPISIVIPCHRVIGANGSLTGYAGGLERKESLLSHELKCEQFVLV